MSPAAIWLVAGLVLGAAEMVAPGVYLLWIGLGAMLTGAAAAAADLNWQWQLGVFACATLGLVGLVGWRTGRRPQPDMVNAPNAGLIGMQCHAVAFEAGEGRVSLRDGSWPARIADGSQPVRGEVLRVVGLDGTTLLVARPTP